MALTAAHTASAIADGITTKQFERRGWYETGSPWILGRHPDTPRLTAVFSAEVLIETVIAERLRRSHTWLRRVWWIPQTVSIGIHSQAAFHNSQLR